MEEKKILKDPLVSVVVHNFNYARYLRQCFDSLVNQTYSNVEILFSDNDSTDESWQIALEYDNKYPGRFSLAKNRRNVGAYQNFRVWASNLSGDFWINVCSDDFIDPRFLERAMDAFKQYPKSSFLLAHRSIVDERGTIKDEAPFFNQSCVLYPPGLSKLFMKASLAPSSSQQIYRVDKSPNASGSPIGSRGLFRSFFGQRITDFLCSLETPMIYIKEPMVFTRIHSNNHGRFSENYMIEIIGAYGLGFEFLEYVQELKPEFLPAFQEEFPSAIEKHARTALRYSARFLKQENFELARRYIFLSLALHPDLENEEMTKELLYLTEKKHKPDNIAFFEKLDKNPNILQRTVSYEPTKPFEPLKFSK